MNFISELCTLFVWLLGLVVFGVGYAVGCLVAKPVRAVADGIADVIGGDFSRTAVALILRGILLVVAVVMYFIYRPTAAELGSILLPTEEFEGITSVFAGRGSGFVVNVLLSTLFDQMVTLVIFGAPLFIGKAILGFAERALCGEEDEPGLVELLGVPELLELLALNVISVCMRGSSPYFAQYVVGGARGGVLGLGLFLLFMVFVIRELFSSDVLLAILAVNVLAAMIGVTVGPENYWMVLGSAILCGLIGSAVRRLVLAAMDEFEDLCAILCGVGTLVGTALVCGVALWPLLDRIVPGLLYGA